jgi:hypothetical protein
MPSYTKMLDIVNEVEQSEADYMFQELLGEKVRKS